MKLKRDRWEDRGQTLPDDMAELKRLASRLEDQKKMHRFDTERLAAAQVAEAEGEAVDADEFRGVVAFDEADRQRAERSAATITARKQAERSGKLVEVGERLCDELSRRIADEHHAACRESQRQGERDLAEIEAALEMKRQQIAHFDVEAESWMYAGAKWLELRSVFSESAARTLATQELQRQAAKHPRETEEQRREREAAVLLGARTLDYNGREVQAYTRLPNGDGGPMRISP